MKRTICAGMLWLLFAGLAQAADKTQAVVELKPESSDEIAALRVWKNTTGDRSIKAELQSVGGDGVTLKKEDNTVVKVPLKMLHKDDQEAVRCFVMTNSKRELVKAVRSFFEADFGDTDARVAENERIEAEKLYKKINGRTIQLVCAIRNVGKPQTSKSATTPNGLYRLDLTPPELAGVVWPDYAKREPVKRGKSAKKRPESNKARTDEERVELRADWQDYVETKLTKEEALKAGTSSVLLIEGKVRLKFSRDDKGYPGRGPGRGMVVFASAKPHGYITLTLDNLKMKVQNPPKKPAAEDAAKDADRAVPKPQE